MLSAQTNLLLALFVEQLSQIVQAAGDGALVGVGVLQVLIWNVGTCQKCAFGLLQVALVHQDDSCVQVGRCEEEGKVIKTTQQGLNLLSITRSTTEPKSLPYAVKGLFKIDLLKGECSNSHITKLTLSRPEMREEKHKFKNIYTCT